LETLYSPGFHTNLVSMQRLEKVGLFWNPREGTLETQDMKPLCRIDKRFKTYFIKWIKLIIRSFAMKIPLKDPISKASEDELIRHRYTGFRDITKYLSKTSITTNSTSSEQDSVICKDSKNSDSESTDSQYGQAAQKDTAQEEEEVTVHIPQQ
jgi:hypothetical protein